MSVRSATGRWDSLLPLGTIAIFVLLGIPVALGAIDFGLEDAGVERYQTIYTDIGIQTTAGIFAIVISLSLVAIQFAAQEYSHRIMEYYIKSSVFWSTVAVYLCLMIAAIFLQARSTDADSARTVGVVLVGSVLALVLLVPHFIVTAAYLRPEFIVAKLMGRITPRYLDSLQRHGSESVAGTSSDRLLPVIEIAERSIERGDVATANNVIARIVGQFEAATIRDGERIALTGYFMSDLNRIGRKAISDADEEPVAVEIIRAINKLTKIGGPIAVPQAASTIDDLLFAAVRNQQVGTIGECIDGLAELYVNADEEVKGHITESLGALIPNLAKSGHRLLSQQLVVRVEEMIATEQPDGHGYSRLLELLESVGRESALRRMVRVVRIVAVSLAGIGRSCFESYPETARGVVLALLRIERSLDHSDADTIAAVGFARNEVERLISPVQEGTGQQGEDTFSGLWDESNQ